MSSPIGSSGICRPIPGSFPPPVKSLISAITGYYAHESSSLLYNKMLEIIPQRCDGLKLNIQIKILHALINAPAPSSGAESRETQGSEDDPTEPTPNL
jgi:hypothetical protein